MKKLIMKSFGRQRGKIILNSRKHVLGELKRDMADYKQEDQKTLNLYVLPYVSLYKALLLNKIDKDAAQEITKDFFFKNVKLLSLFYRTWELIPGFFKGFRRFMEKGLFSADEDFIEVLQSNQEGMIFHMKRCLYLEFCSRIDHPELCGIFCDGDDETYGKMKTVKFIRSKTLAAGDPVCDFHLYNKKSR